MESRVKITPEVSRRVKLSSREIVIAVALSLAAIAYWLATKAPEKHSADIDPVDRAAIQPAQYISPQ